MALVTTQLTTERSDMHPSMIDKIPVKEWQLNATDRCDRCTAQALVQVNGLDGILMFCGHHYNKIMNNPEGYKKMMSFMISVIDEREKLIENKAKEEPHA
jgi:hypothetical protein